MFPFQHWPFSFHRKQISFPPSTPIGPLRLLTNAPVSLYTPLHHCLHCFVQGQWIPLLTESRQSSERALQHQNRRRRTQSDTLERRAERAEALVHLGELSSGRQVLEGAALAPGNEVTRRALTDATRRPPIPRAPLSQDLLTHQPAVPFILSKTVLLKNLKCAKRGAAGGPSSMTAEHVRPLLESTRDCDRFWSMCQSLARGSIPDEIIATIRMGRMTALQKPSGGVRGIVVGDFVRRLVSRTIAQQLAPAIEHATAPFQYALTTRAGCECIGHILLVETDSFCEKTVLSVDGIGAFDLVSRESTLRGLFSVQGGESILPFVRQFYGAPSTYLWQDDAGGVHEIHQGEGGEQGDALMPALFCLGQHSALVAVQRQLQPDERLMAFLDDLYVSCNPWTGSCRYLTSFTVSCGLTPASKFTWGRHRFGTEAGWSLLVGIDSPQMPGYLIQTPSCGVETTLFLQSAGYSCARHSSGQPTIRQQRIGEGGNQPSGAPGQDPTCPRFAECVASASLLCLSSTKLHPSDVAPSCHP